MAADQTPKVAERVKTIEERLDDLETQLKALNDRPTVDADAIKRALEEHPHMAEFREFLEKWRNH